MELKTPLYDAHVKAGGKSFPFAGYSYRYSMEQGVITEHMTVKRKSPGLSMCLIWERYCARKRCTYKPAEEAADK